jgi:serine/threonine protein kinase
VGNRLGTHLDRYEIDAELGRGAMGVVYRARDPKLDRTVAIKTVSLSGLDAEADQEYRKRFVVEAKAAGRLSHPGIVTVFDVREEEEEPFLVMEYVEGQSLQQLVTRENRTLPLSTTLRMVQEIAEALHYAHCQGVIHRDIKPANILVTADGHPKIADFGIAKLNQTELTSPGQVLGSPAFMAPEQLSEEAVDARSDLFSVGVILYYMLTGHRPFQGNSTTTVCFKLVNHEPLHASAFNSKLPPDLDKIVSRAIAKDPNQRYQTGMAMAADIHAVRESSGFMNLEGTASLPKRDAMTQRAGADSGQTELSVFSKAILIVAFLAVTVGGVAFWSTHSARNDSQQQSAPPEPKQTAQPVDLTPEKTAPTVSEKAKPAARPVVSKKEKQKLAGKTIDTKSSAPIATAKVLATNAPAPAAHDDAILQIEIDHHFNDAVASVWVDDNLVYAQTLHGDKQRRALVFRKVIGHQFEVVRTAPGKHQFRVRVQSAATSYDQSKIVTGALAQGVSLLRIVCDDKGTGLQISLQKGTYQ